MTDLVPGAWVYHRGRDDYGRFLGVSDFDIFGLAAWVEFEQGGRQMVIAESLVWVCPHLVEMTDGCLKCERVGVRRATSRS